MKKIKVLDCTLRDGGYINDWNFGEKEIEDIIVKLEESHVDILEVGFLKDEKYSKDRVVFNSMEQISELIIPKKNNIEYAAMAEVVNPLPLEKIAQHNEDTVDIIRVIVWKRLLQEGYEYCKGIVEKGYKLCVQPARVDQYTHEEFIDMVRMFNEINPMALYVVDSFGTQNRESLFEYMQLADKYANSDMYIGYHGHNNLLQAFGVAEAFINFESERNMIIDASVYGMGRGAGNLNLEILTRYLNEIGIKKYSIDPMIEIYNKYLAKEYEKCEWGYSIPFYLSALNKCNPNYASYYREKNVDYEDMNNIMKTILEDDKIVYSDDKAKLYIETYSKKVKHR